MQTNLRNVGESLRCGGLHGTSGLYMADGNQGKTGSGYLRFRFISAERMLFSVQSHAVHKRRRNRMAEIRAAPFTTFRCQLESRWRRRLSPWLLRKNREAARSHP